MSKEMHPPRRQTCRALPADALLTPSARDLLRDWRKAGATPAFAKPAAPGRRLTRSRRRTPAKPLHAEKPRPNWRPSSTRRVRRTEAADLRDGPRLWQRAYVDGNGGNIAIRVGDDMALCTPTLVSKGFMKPEDLCLVDFEGNQLLGTKKRTSEILMHLQIMKRQPKAGGLGALSSALRHRVRRGRRLAAHLHDPRVRGVLRGGHRPLPHAGHAGDGQAGGRPGRTSTTPSSWPTTAW
jgi:hypothetical protein